MLHATHRGEFFGVPAAGRHIAVKDMFVDRVVAGKMVESRILVDSVGMMTRSSAPFL
jgi:predicted ester cyclase